MVQLDQRYNVDEALADPYFDITFGLNGQLRSDGVNVAQSSLICDVQRYQESWS